MAAKSDKNLLKPLVEKVLELAARAEEDKKKELWARHNALLSTDKIPVCVTFEGIPGQHWDAMFGEKHLKCKSDLAKEIEFYLKRRIWAAENIPDDHVVWAAMSTSAVVAKDYDWGVKLEWQKSDNDLGARHIIAPFEEKIELDRLKPPLTTIDDAATKKKLEEMAELVGGKLLIWPRYETLGESPFEHAVTMRGMEKIFFDVFDNPELLKGMMEFITNATVADHRQREKNGWLNCPADPSGRYQMIPVLRHIAGYLPEGFHKRKPLLSDEWAYVSAQSAMGLGPEQYEEFVHRYDCKIAELYTNKTVYYHGCECLDQKLDVIATLPNLRRHHVSPWSSVALAAEKYRNSVNLEVHAHPGKVMMGSTPEEMRQEVEGLVKGAGGHRMNLNLSDIHSVNGKPETLKIWAKIAQDVVTQ